MTARNAVGRLSVVDAAVAQQPPERDVVAQDLPRGCGGMKAPRSMRMAPISTGRAEYSCASSTRRKYHGRFAERRQRPQRDAAAEMRARASASCRARGRAASDTAAGCRPACDRASTCGRADARIARRRSRAETTASPVESSLQSRRVTDGLGVADARVLGLEEARQQRRRPAAALRASARRARRRPGAGSPRPRSDASGVVEALEDVHAVLVAEVRRADRAALELQHELADQPLLVARAGRRG